MECKLASRCAPCRIRLQWRAVGIREDQIQVDAIVRSELAPELILALAVRIQRRDLMT